MKFKSSLLPLVVVLSQTIRLQKCVSINYISPWQLEQDKYIGAGQRTHVSSVSSTMYRLHFCHSLIGKDSIPGRGKVFFFLISRMQIVSWGPLRLPFNGYCKKGCAIPGVEQTSLLLTTRLRLGPRLRISDAVTQHCHMSSYRKKGQIYSSLASMPYV
jgi:hypothetical protein